MVEKRDESGLPNIFLILLVVGTFFILIAPLFGWYVSGVFLMFALFSVFVIDMFYRAYRGYKKGGGLGKGLL